MTSHSKRARNAGFTLLEIAIVCAVVAFLAGAVVVGQHVMERAEYTKFEADARNYAIALAEFEKTYKGLPGDIVNASSYFPALSATANGNGNGVIDPAEQALFWQHMQISGLLGEAMPLIPNTAAPASSRDNAGYAVTQDPALGVVMELSAYQDVSGVMTGGFSALTPAEAAIMEQRDDGNPATGKIRARAGTDATGNCTVQTVSGGITTTSLDQTNKQKACVIQFVAAELAVNTNDVQEQEIASCGTVGDVRKAGGTCPAGYQGEITETCTPQGWQETNNCTIVVCDGGVYNQQRDVSCPAGYTGRIIQTCNQNGQWIVSSNSCAVPAGSACAVPNATKTIPCTVGKSGSIIQTCTAGVWLTTTDNCQASQCGSESVGALRETACPAGYTGIQQEVCVSGGQWMAKPLNSNCVLAEETCASNQEAATREFGCPPGSAGLVTQRCTSQKWVTKENTCKAATCGDKPIGATRTAENQPCPNSTTVGTVEEICGPEGKWIEISNSCTQKVCSSEGAGAVGNASWPTTNVGQMGLGTCATGYSMGFGAPQTQPRRSCDDGGDNVGVWSGLESGRNSTGGGQCLPSCQLSSATGIGYLDARMTPDNTGQWYPHGQSVPIVCATGFSQGGGTLTCNMGAWSGSVTACKADCATLTPTGGAVITSGPHGTVRTSSCTAGYGAHISAATTSTLTCTDGTWSGTPVACYLLCSGYRYGQAQDVNTGAGCGGNCATNRRVCGATGAFGGWYCIAYTGACPPPSGGGGGCGPDEHQCNNPCGGGGGCYPNSQNCPSCGDWGCACS